MASLKNIKLKILSYKKTGTVTHAMEAVSAVKMRKSQERALGGRSYAAAALSILERLSGFLEYEAEIKGWALRVAWRAERPAVTTTRPPTPAVQRGFLWSAKGPGGLKRSAHEAHEEIEIAMAEAEAETAAADH